MATVYLAQDLKHDRPVALKVLHPALAHTLGPERFQREIRLAARLQHPHVLTVHDSGESAGQLWFTMPFVEGESLRDRLVREKQLPVEDALRITREAAMALEYAHQHGVVHRDIKPENILLTRDGSTLVADFGVARAIRGGADQLTETGMAIGTPAYMSPEQASGERDLDARSDIYALGAVLYEMLAGRPPFSGATAQAVIVQTLSAPPAQLAMHRPGINPVLDQVVQKALAKSPADRFATMSELARALPRGTGTAAVAAPGRRGPVILRRPLVLTLIIGFALGLGVLFAWRRGHGPGEDAGARVLAVLPFENLGDAADEYFADGITDEVRGKLATFPGLQVIASSSAGQYKHSGKSPEEIARELGAQYLLVGKIRWQKSANGPSRVQVSPELIQVVSGAAPKTRWQQPFDAAITDVFQVQADIAGRVAEALNLALAAATQQQLSARPTQDLAAYDAYLRGVEERGKGGTSETLRSAIGHFEQAVALDTGFVAAWAALSEATSLLRGQGPPTEQLAQQARAAAERALALGPNRPEGYAALGDYYRRVERDNQRALEEYGRGASIGPANAAILRGTSLSEMALGRVDASLDHLKQAQRLDPRSYVTVANLALTLHYLRRYDEAIRAADQALALTTPDNPNAIERRVMILLSKGDLAGARSYLRGLPRDVEPGSLVAYLATYYDLVWVLEPEQQALLLRLGPSQFDGDRGAWGLALAGTYYLKGNAAAVRAYADSARVAIEAQLRDAPEDAQLHVLLGTALAFLGKRDAAIAEGRHGVELLPISRDLPSGAYNQHQLARIYLILGDQEKALDALEPLLKVPYYLSPGWLRIDPTFDPLRKNPRFQSLLQGP